MEPISEGRDPQATTAGAWLRNARQQRGLHIAALAVMLKVPQSKLEALEADRWDELPDATFARALATAMCRVLKVDPAPALALLPRTNDREFDVRPGLNQPFRERGAGPIDGGPLALLKRPVAWGFLLLVLAAAAIYWVPAGWVERDGSAASSAATGVVGTASAPVEFIPAPSASEPAASEPTVAVAASAPAAAASLPVREVAASVAPAPVPVPAVAIPAGQALRITASADSWIEVVDAKGQIVLSRVLRAGEQQELGGAAPYKVRVGNVGGTKIEWRGNAVDLAARASNNVARVELN